MPTHKIINRWRNLQTIHLLLAALIILTTVLLVWQHFGMNTFLRFDPSHFKKISVNDDREHINGKSISRLTTSPDFWRLDCQLNEGYRAPYCSLDLDLSLGEQGINIDNYDQITIRYRYPIPNEQALLMLVNFNPVYSTLDDYRSQKFNEVFLPSTNEWLTSHLNGNQFNVASWWVAYKKILPEWTINEFNNVREIRLATGMYPQQQQYQIDLAYIELSGKWISTHNLQLLLLVLWGGSAACWLIAELRRAMRALHRSHTRHADLENTQRHLKELNQLLAERSMRDPLTLAFNREGLSVILANEQPNTPSSIIFIDIDYFKKINDNYGHAIGDQVLCLLTQHIQQQIRPSEKLIRLGGEEFVLLCQHSALAQAGQLAEKLRLWLFSQSWPTGTSLSCSFGVAERLENESFEAALHRADLALYRAKTAGRNRVEIAEEE
ncbi:GGDEF domain-containing protein [Iodobacter fluviatilis]|uniref:diguanylate cyclase n=1 Tax=Iodobacter fluviatilis TaxID=537 RepID=A0A7G3GAV8_9NEIS|nr:GGDEF domain-containing protein [Iodobacter fluviatilis]QBC44527.1 hypothetical protein C1H71_14000 [Iodobacter fluviatilis]